MTVGLSLSGGSKESHGKQIYCISFSDDIHVGYTHAAPARDPKEEGFDQPSGNQGRDERDVIVIDSSSDDEKMTATETPRNEKPMDNTKTFYCYYMVTCGGNHLTLYQIQSSCEESNVTNSNISSNHALNDEDADFVVRQGYRDVDEDEIYYSCTFAGRCRLRGDQFKSIPTSLHKQNKIYSSESNHHKNLNYHQDDEDHCGPQLCCVGGKRGK